MKGTLEEQVGESIRGAIVGAVDARLRDYNSPLIPLIIEAVKKQEQNIRELLEDAIAGALADRDFRTQVRVAIRHKIARALTEQFGESVFKKSIDALKADPTMKARCVLAVEKIVGDSINLGGPS